MGFRGGDHKKLCLIKTLKTDYFRILFLNQKAFLPNYLFDKGLKGTGLNLEYLSMEGPLEITLTVPLS